MKKKEAFKEKSSRVLRFLGLVELLKKNNELLISDEKLKQIKMKCLKTIAKNLGIKDINKIIKKPIDKLK